MVCTQAKKKANTVGELKEKRLCLKLKKIYFNITKRSFFQNNIEKNQNTKITKTSLHYSPMYFGCLFSLNAFNPSIRSLVGTTTE
jgi:hypothetical protein